MRTTRHFLRLTTAAGMLILCAVGAGAGDLTVDGLTVTREAAFLGNVTVKDASQAEAPAEGLALYYGFTSADSPVPDESGNAHDGTVVGATWVENGVTGGGYLFDGTSDYIDMGQPISLSGAFSVSAWINPAAWEYASYRTVVAQIVGGQATGFSLEKKGNTSGTLSLWIADGSTWREAVSPSPVLSGAWSHVMAVYDGTNMALYLNGQAGTPVATPAIGLNSATMLLGHSAWLASDPYRYFGGLMDEVRLYSRALSAAEIQQLYFRDAHLAAGTARFETGVTFVKPLGDLSMGVYTNQP